MKYRLCFCLIILLKSVVCIARTSNPQSDSLRSVLLQSIAKKKGDNDTGKINNLNKLASAYESSYPDSAVYYAQMAIRMSRKINYNKGIADGMVASADIYIPQGKYAMAVDNLNQSIKLYTVLNDLSGLGNCYETYGYRYYETSNYQKALFYFNKSLAIYLTLKSPLDISTLYKLIGNTYSDLGNFSTALDYHFKTLNIVTRLHNKRQVASEYNNIAVVLQNMEIYPKALEYYYKALNTFTQIGSYKGVAVTKQNIGEVYTSLGKYDDAIKYLNASLSIFIKQDDKDGSSSVYNDMGVCYVYEKQNTKALDYLQISLKLAADNQLDEDRTTALTNIALYYNLNSDFKEAYKYALQAKSLADHIGSTSLRTSAYVEWIKALGGLQMYKDAFIAQKEFDQIKLKSRMDESLQKFTSYNSEFNYADKQRQQELQQKASALLLQQKIHDQRLLNFIFFIIISAMMVIAGVYYLQKRKQIKINRQLVEKNHQVEEQRVNLDDQSEKLNELNKLKDRLIAILAHDLRSPLSTLRGLFRLLEDDSLTMQEVLEMIPSVVKKLDYTSDFLDTLLFWVNSQMDNFDNDSRVFSINEVINPEIENYQEHASAKGIKLVDNLSGDLMALADPNSVRIVVRNLVTNAIKFSRENDDITVNAVAGDDHILISVKDTGVGMTADQKNKLFKNKMDSKTGTKNESGTGMGMLFCKDLVEKGNGRIWVESEPEEGTTFCFTVPLPEKGNHNMKLMDLALAD